MGRNLHSQAAAETHQSATGVGRDDDMAIALLFEDLVSNALWPPAMKNMSSKSRLIFSIAI